MIKKAVKATLIIITAITAVTAYSTPGDSYKEMVLTGSFNDGRNLLSLDLRQNEVFPERTYYELTVQFPGYHFFCSSRADSLISLDILPTAVKGSFKITNSGEHCDSRGSRLWTTLEIDCTANGIDTSSDVGNTSTVSNGVRYIYHVNKNSNSATCTIAIDQFNLDNLQSFTLQYGQYVEKYVEQ